MCCRTNWFKKKKLQLFKHVCQKDDTTEHSFRRFKKFLNEEDDKKNNGQEHEKGNKVFQKLLRERNEQGNTALHYAAKAGNLKICKILEQRGAEIGVKNENKMTPLEFAARYGDGHAEVDVFNCIKWLMEKTNATETKILHHAIQNRNWAANTFVARELIGTGKCKISETDKDENTSLHLAAKFDKDEDHRILDLFLEKGNINDEDLIKCLEAENKKGRTPYHIACSVRNHESVEQLINKGKELGVDVGKILNSRDVDQRLPIYTAIDSDNFKLLDLLMSCDIGLHITNNDVIRAAR